MKRIYVCSPLRDNPQDNTKMAQRYCEYVAKKFGFLPVAPHIYFPQFLDDNIPTEREFCMKAGLFLLSICDELWYFGGKVSRGMTEEIDAAMRYGIPVKYIPTHHYDTYLKERNKSNENQ